MFIISKTIKGKEYSYSSRHTILCNNEKQARMLADFMNKHNDTVIGDFKLKDNETWYTYEIDEYDTPPKYKLSCVRGKIAIKEVL